jgi:hypothetical protein
MRAALLMSALLTVPAMAEDTGVLGFGESMAKASAGALTPLQMPDGSKLFRFVGKELKGEEIEMRYADLIAHALGKALWCSAGWQETKRSTPTRGFVLIEGRCK